MHKLQFDIEKVLHCMHALYIVDKFWSSETGLNIAALYSTFNAAVSVKVFISEF